MHLGQQILSYTTKLMCDPKGWPMYRGSGGTRDLQDQIIPKKPPQIKHLETFSKVLDEWGCTWMWQDMCLTGDDGWL